MRLQDKLPDHVRVNGRKVRLDLEFRNVLRMMDTLGRDDLLPEAREWLACRCICRHPRKGMLKEVRKLLFPEAVEREKITDFEQDADLIRAAFMQEYGINLFRDRLHWFEFACLLSCIPAGNKYSDILNIRIRPMPAATNYNAEERAWLARMKAEFGLKLSDNEQEQAYSRNVQRLGAMLLAMAGEGDNNGGRTGSIRYNGQQSADSEIARRNDEENSGREQEMG